jgi:protein-S-isoprenylcysteine O-methyltransferase Ste14
MPWLNPDVIFIKGDVDERRKRGENPLYFFGLLFLWLTSIMTANMLVVFIFLNLYLLIGAYFEERKLSQEFGALYAEYKSRTPMFIPGLTIKQHESRS